MSRRLGDDPERGIVLVLVAASLVVLLVIAALVLDVGYAYAVGRQEQTVADLSALAAARHLPGDPIGACQDGWDYVKANLSSLPGNATMPCSSFPSTCDDTTAAADYTATSTGGFTITFSYPVLDADPLMSSQAIVQPYDGTDPCSRFGVRISHKDTSFFSGIAGIGGLYPHVKAVARYWTGPDTGNVANLVSLDPIGCIGIEVNGVTSTEVVVDSYIPAPGKPAIPGAIAVDSDGTACSGGKTTVDAAGSAHINAEPTTGSEPGEISLYAMPGDQTTCSVSTHDCNPSQVPSNIAPQPIPSQSRVTRAPADHVYNCKSIYPLYDGGAGPSPAPWAVPIAGCDTSDSKRGGPYIDELTAAIQTDIANNTPPDSTWNVFPTCTVKTSNTYTGNWWVNCPNGFKLQKGGNTPIKVVFEGNVIFNGSVDQSGGELDFEGNPNSSIDPSCEPPSLSGSPSADAANCLDESSYVPSPSAPALFTDTAGKVQQSCQLGTYSGGAFSPYSPAPDCASFVYLNGSMTPSNSSYTLNFNGTFVYVTASPQSASNFGCAVQSKANSITSNAGTANWIGPTDGLFNNLALWSESGSGNNSSGGSTTASFSFAGGGNTTVDGVFFTPCTQFGISGKFLNPQTAQFLTFQLSVGGGSQLTMVPVPNRQLPTAPSGSLLIR